MKTIVTHSGKFHADDVFAVATLLLAFDEEASIIRTRDVDIIKTADIVVDVGGVYDASTLRFDHHQVGGAGVRENGIPYAAFGLVWKSLGEQVCGGSKDVALQIDNELVAPLDAGDNGVSTYSATIEGVAPYTISNAINAFVSTWKEDYRDMDRVFVDMVNFAKALIAREVVRVRAREEARGLVEKAYAESEDKRIIILDGPYPTRDILAHYPEPLFFIRPRPFDETWSVETVRTDPHTFTNRKNLPASWAGKTDEEFAQISGVPDALFCHRALFMAAAKSKEGAIELARKAINL